MAARTADSYARALGVALAYSALESLRKATGQRGTRQVMEDAVLAQRYRSVGLTKLRDLLESTTEYTPLRERLGSLATSTTEGDALALLRPASGLLDGEPGLACPSGPRDDVAGIGRDEGQEGLLLSRELVHAS